MLTGSTDLPVRCVEWAKLDPQNEAEVLVLDAISLEGLRKPLAHPDRVVLIAREEPGLLRNAWEAGVNSVVFDRDPLSTVVLAILSACLRQTRPRETGAR
jgi:AmiR/NasT family two-component response regulator